MENHWTYFMLAVYLGTEWYINTVTLRIRFEELPFKEEFYYEHDAC